MIALVGLVAALSLAVTPAAFAGEVELRLPRVRHGAEQPVCLCSPTGAIGAWLTFAPLPGRQVGEVVGPQVVTSRAYLLSDGVVVAEAQCSMLPQGRVVTYPLGAEPVAVPLGDLEPGEGRGVTVRTWKERRR